MVNRDPEARPLLPNKVQVTPLPRAQVAVILLARLAEPIAYTQFLPYINSMVEGLGIAEPERVGFYSGMINGLFPLAQLCTIVYWGSLSDRIGRSPVVRSAISDITDENNQSKAFALLSAVWSIGAIIGPFLGGMLSHPAECYPSLFGAIPLLRERPFFLPCLVSGLITLTAILVTIFCMKETLPCLEKDREPDRPFERPSPIKDAAQYPQLGLAERPSLVQVTTLGLLSNRRVRQVVVVGFSMSFLLYTVDSIIVLWSYTPLVIGGLQQEPRAIGAVLSTTGLLGIATTVIAFPYLHKRVKTVPLLTATIGMCGVIYVLIPIVEFIIRKALPPIGQQDPAPPLGRLWVFVLCIMLADNVALMSYTAYLIVVKESIPNSQSVGALFGLVTAACSLGEGLAPPFVSSLFALSIDRQILGGNFVWLVMVGLSALGTWFSHFGLERSVG